MQVYIDEKTEVRCADATFAERGSPKHQSRAESRCCCRPAVDGAHLAEAEDHTL